MAEYLLGDSDSSDDDLAASKMCERTYEVPWSTHEKWKKYGDPESGSYWWSSPAGTNWFWEKDSRIWEKFQDPQFKRYWWYSENDWFFEDTGLQV